MHTFSSLVLSSELGYDVDVMYPKAIRDHAARIDIFMKAMSDGAPVVGRLRIPNTAGDIVTEIDLRAQQITASIEVKAPEDKGSRGRIGWLLAQLNKADGAVILEAYPRNARVPLSTTLDSARADRYLLLGPDKAEANRFIIKRRVSMTPGRKSTSRKPGFVDGFMALLAEFYEGIVQDLTAWQPPAPKRKAPVEEKEPELPSE